MNFETVVFLSDSNITYIGTNAFQGCVNLKSIELPVSLISIGSNAFSNCSRLKSIEIPAQVTDIPVTIFKNADLESITVASGNSVYKSDGNCIIEIETNTLIIGIKTSIIPSYVTGINSDAFLYVKIENIVIPASVKSIGDNAFSNCSELQSITIENGSQIESLGLMVFMDSRKLADIYFSDTKAEWNAIIGSDTISENITIHCSDGIY